MLTLTPMPAGTTSVRQLIPAPLFACVYGVAWATHPLASSTQDKHAGEPTNPALST